MAFVFLEVRKMKSWKFEVIYICLCSHQSKGKKKEKEKKRKSMKTFWVRKLYHKNEKEREILDTLLWIFTSSFNIAIAFLYIMPYYSQQIWKIIFYGKPHFRKGMKITVFIKNKIICIRRFSWHPFLCSLFWFKHIGCIVLIDNLID